MQNLPTSNNFYEPSHIKDEGLIKLENWDSYLECDDAYLHVGYMQATEAITGKLSEILKNNSSPEEFRKSIEELVNDRRILIEYADKKMCEDIDNTFAPYIG